MKAVTINKYGGNDVVEIRDVPTPICGPGDVLIKVHAASINPVDWKVRYGHVKIFTGSKFPMILGNECSGEVVEAGSHVTKLKKGDLVIGYPGVRRLGAYAEYACVSEATTFPKPGIISFGQASAIPIAGLTALQALRDHGKIASGRKVLINGASGGVGHFSVQIAKIFGADVTAVCSGVNAEFVKGLGADRAIDYQQQDFAEGSELYDLIFDAVSMRSFKDVKKVLTSKGIYVNTLPSLSIYVSQFITSMLPGRKAKSLWVKSTAPDMDWMKKQVEAGKIKIIIDRTYPLDQTQDALAYSETGKARGKIALKMV